MSAQLEELQGGLGYSFDDPSLLDLALTHRSCGPRNNERLEFLGDSILNHVIAEYLFASFPTAGEGDLSRMRAALVRRRSLAAVARQLEMGNALRLGPGERKSGGHRRESILADTLEAVIGAVLLDGGQGVVRERVLAWFANELEDVSPQSAPKDAKTRLQEYLQGRGLPVPEYHLAKVEGEDHRQEFTVECRIASPALSLCGSGSSRRRAEQAAAGAVLEVLHEH